jgi:UDP-N-acetylmuramyl pentapeptide phosphotransferase/UDP-N-acetylglucosamine-1-phosphate transferase
MNLAWQAAAAAFVFVGAALGTRALIPTLLRLQLLDRPNHRSSHVLPTPRGGGLAPVLVLVVAGLLAGWWLGMALPAGLALLAALLAALSFADDRGSLTVGLRLASHCMAAAIGLVLITLAMPMPGLPLPLLAACIGGLLVGWVWFINLFNFMDGIDGISGAELVAIGLGTAAVAALHGTSGSLAPVLAGAGLCLAAAGAGFLISNWHPAKVFLGDAGSIPLGFLAGALLIVLALVGHPVAALVLPAYYIVDATVTLLLRMLRNENLGVAHRSHAYQRAVQAGLTHDMVCLGIAVVNVVLLLLALLSPIAPALSLVLGYGLAGTAYLALPRLAGSQRS